MSILKASSSSNQNSNNNNIVDYREAQVFFPSENVNREEAAQYELWEEEIFKRREENEETNPSNRFPNNIDIKQSNFDYDNTEDRAIPNYKKDSGIEVSDEISISPKEIDELILYVKRTYDFVLSLNTTSFDVYKFLESGAQPALTEYPYKNVFNNYYEGLFTEEILYRELNKDEWYGRQLAASFDLNYNSKDAHLPNSSNTRKPLFNSNYIDNRGSFNDFKDDNIEEYMLFVSTEIKKSNPDIQKINQNIDAAIELTEEGLKITRQMYSYLDLYLNLIRDPNSELHQKYQALSTETPVYEAPSYIIDAYEEVDDLINKYEYFLSRLFKIKEDKNKLITVRLEDPPPEVIEEEIIEENEEEDNSNEEDKEEKIAPILKKPDKRIQLKERLINKGKNKGKIVPRLEKEDKKRRRLKEKLINREIKPTDTEFPSINKERWGIKFTTDKESKFPTNWYMQLLPAIRSNQVVQGGVDAPGAQPGINFKIQQSLVKHKIPGSSPIYQSVGIDSIKCILVGCFVGIDDNNLERLNQNYDSFQSPYNNRLDQVQKNQDALRNVQEFYNKIVLPGKEISIEVNIRRTHSLAIQGESGIFRNSTSGNLEFNSFIRRMDIFYARRDRAWYILELEVLEKRENVECINITNIINTKLKEIEEGENGTEEDEIIDVEDRGILNQEYEEAYKCIKYKGKITTLKTLRYTIHLNESSAYALREINISTGRRIWLYSPTSQGELMPFIIDDIKGEYIKVLAKSILNAYNLPDLGNEGVGKGVSSYSNPGFRIGIENHKWIYNPKGLYYYDLRGKSVQQLSSATKRFLKVKEEQKYLSIKQMMKYISNIDIPTLREEKICMNMFKVLLQGDIEVFYRTPNICPEIDYASKKSVVIER